MEAVRGARRGVRGWLAETSDALVSVFFPGGCRICDRSLVRASRVPICDACLDSFEALPSGKCDVYGQPLPSFSGAEEAGLVCPACQQKTYAFERAGAATESTMGRWCARF